MLRDIAELATRTLDAVLANVTDGVMIANGQGEVMLCNRAFRELTGCSGWQPAEVVRTLFPDRPSAQSILADLAHSDVPCRAQTTISPPGGGRIPVETTAARIDGIGDSSGVLVTLRDLRETPEAQDRILEALCVSLAGERIARLAHRIENYLAPAFYHADALAQRDDIEENTRRSVTTIQNYLHLCHESIHAVSSLIRPPVPAPVDVNELLSEALSRDGLAEELRLDGIEIVHERDPGAAPAVGYRELLHQTFVNVIRSVRQATGKGRLTVSTQAGADTIAIHVCHDGREIPEENKARAFDGMPASAPFEIRSESGFHFAEEVIARHGGTIHIESPPGKAVKIEIRLPTPKPENPADSGASTDI
jgi:PAS domain S-box-containing protein